MILDFILREILMFCFRNSPPMEWIFKLCKEAEIPYSKLVKVLSDYRQALFFNGFNTFNVWEI